MKRALVCGAALLVLAGCGSTQNSAGGSADSGGPSASATASASTAPGNDSGGGSGSAKGEASAAADASGGSGTTAKQPAKLTECGLTERDIAYMQRDWERVVGSVGRGDHGKYTHAFVVRLESLQKQGKDCPADQTLSRFIAAAERVDKAAEQPANGDGMYRRVANTGNEWLDHVGITPDQLAAG